MQFIHTPHVRLCYLVFFDFLHATIKHTMKVCLQGKVIETGKWDKVMSAALSVPGVKVSRNEFLVASSSNLCSTEQLKQIR